MIDAPVLTRRTNLPLNTSLNFDSLTDMWIYFQTWLPTDFGTLPYSASTRVVDGGAGLMSGLNLVIERESRKLNNFLALPQNWDSYGAPSVQPSAVEQALILLRAPAFARLISPQWPRVAVFPLSNGGVQLDLNGGRLPLEIEINPEGNLEFTFFGASNEIVWEGSTLAEAVAWYTTLVVG